MPKLNDKTAIVTGGAHGIGKAVCEVFAEAGATVFVADLDEKAGEACAAGIRAAGGKATFVMTDVSQAEQAARVVKLAAEKNGRIDILCNNAAYIGKWHNSTEATVEEWEKCLSVSLMGTQYFTREALAYMVKQKSGSIINISSIQGMVGGRNSTAYTTVKSGLLGFTRSVAYDYGQQGVRVNAICPGAITTRISPQPGTELYDRQVSKTFLGRVGTPREVANVALFLASDDSSYVTGAVLPVDGGWTAM